MNTAEDLAYITSGPDGVFIEVHGGFGDAIQLRSAGDVIAFLTGVTDAANKIFGTKIKVLTADELNVAPYTWAEHQAANQASLDEIAAAMGLDK